MEKKLFFSFLSASCWLNVDGIAEIPSGTFTSPQHSVMVYCEPISLIHITSHGGGIIAGKSTMCDTPHLELFPLVNLNTVHKEELAGQNIDCLHNECKKSTIFVERKQTLMCIGFQINDKSIHSRATGGYLNLAHFFVFTCQCVFWDQWRDKISKGKDWHLIWYTSSLHSPQSTDTHT